MDIGADAIDAKLIGQRRGGYCFEQNGLFLRALRAIGFAAEGLIGRVRWMLPDDAPPTPRSHMVVRVTIDGRPWLADVGFGAAVPPQPLAMDSEEDWKITRLNSVPHSPLVCFLMLVKSILSHTLSF